MNPAGQGPRQPHGPSTSRAAFSPPGVRRRAGRAAAVAVVAALLATGCHSDGRQQPLAAAPPAGVPELTAAESALLDRAELLLIRDCMRRRGFDYLVAPRPARPQYRDFPYVVDDAGWARRHGYGADLQRRRDAAARAEPNTKRLDALAPADRAAELFALNGVAGADTDVTAVLPSGVTTRRSASSCTSEAERGLYGDLPAWYRAERVTENLPGLRVHLVLGDARYRRAAAAWSRCMARAGHRYDEPAQARYAVLSADPPMPRAQEIALAVAEATCADRTGLSATAADLDRRYARVVDDRYAAEIADRRRLQRGALPGAHAIVLAG
ncbi:hypothetical protein [Actinoplanes sp. NPDC026623]|uniref:hypothetical protein n=1 Tax=Actinoplanes sp. NPDC026623 TaxID=3155610 RepID=UPI00340DA484